MLRCAAKEKKEKMKKTADKQFLYEEICQYCKEPPAQDGTVYDEILIQKLTFLLQKLEQYRRMVAYTPIKELLGFLIQDTGYDTYVSSMPGGDQRQANIALLLERAGNFEKTSFYGLFHFIRYLETMQEQEVDFGEANILDESADVVRVMTIHKSKGLEFPICFVCGLAKQFNQMDARASILMDVELGIGVDCIDPVMRTRRKTMRKNVVAQRMKEDTRGEDLRVLYVALTRAKEKLILSVALTGGARDLEKLAPDAACPVEPQVLAGCQSVGQWVLLPALARPDGEALRRAAGVQVPVPAADFGPAWDIRFVDGAEFQAEPEESAISPSGPPDGEMISAGAGEETAALAARLAWHYPHGAEVELPSKLTATQLKGRALDEEVAEAAVRPPRPIRLGRPRFAAEEFGLTPAQKGTALHLVMQYIDFERTERVEQVRAEIARLVERAFLTPQQGEAVDPAKIAAFFASPLGRELMASTSLRREFKFSILVPAADYYPQAGAEEQVLLQGVVDCCFETLEGITVVDFKTDRVDRRSVAARAEEYRPQLAAYSRALEEITGKPVIRRCLWFFALDQAVDV